MTYLVVRKITHSPRKHHTLAIKLVYRKPAVQVKTKRLVTSDMWCTWIGKSVLVLISFGTVVGQLYPQTGCEWCYLAVTAHKFWFKETCLNQIRWTQRAKWNQVEWFILTLSIRPVVEKKPRFGILSVTDFISSNRISHSVGVWSRFLHCDSDIHRLG